MPGRYRRPTTPQARARADEARAAKLQALHDRLADEVAALRTGEDWQRWLATAARFHSYSFGNTLLILAQRPDATAVAGYEAWKALGRQVDKGEKGIAILAPIVRRRSPDAATGPGPDDGRPTDGDRPTDKDTRTDGATTPSASATGHPASRSITGFRIAYVWDVTQTSGRPLPEPPTPQLLHGQAPDGLWDALAGAVASAGYTLQRGPCDGANGVTIPATRTVRVRDDLDDAQAVKTLAHELAHIQLHTTAATASATDPITDPTGSQATEPVADTASVPVPCRGVREVEAESVAYLVTAAHGLDSSGYTFPYVALWADGVAGLDVEDVVRATGERVLRAARRILAATTEPAPGHDDRAAVLAERATSAATVKATLRARAEATRQTTPKPPSDRTTGRSPRQEPGRAPTRNQNRTASRTTSRAPTATRGRRDVGNVGDFGDVGRADLLEAQRLALAFFRDRLAASWVPGYLTGRGLAAALDGPWFAGYAPASWTALTDRLREQGLDDAVLLACGLATRARTGNLIDRFRDRLVLPLRAGDGHLVGFIARAHPDADPDRTPKYLNSPHSAVYRKAELLHGLAEARAALDRGARPVLVEGPLDAIAVTAGTEGRCVGLAACGTALTDAHVDALAAAVDLRARGVVVATDADAAGLASARSALDLLSARGITPAAATLPAGADPACVLHDQGPAALTAALLDRTAPLADRIVDAHLAAHTERHQWFQGRLHTVRELAPLLARLPIDDIGRQAARLADRLEIEPGVVQREIVPFIGLEPPPAPGRRRWRTTAPAPRSTAVPPRPHRTR